MGFRRMHAGFYGAGGACPRRPFWGLAVKGKSQQGRACLKRPSAALAKGVRHRGAGPMREKAPKKRPAPDCPQAGGRLVMLDKTEKIT